MSHSNPQKFVQRTFPPIVGSLTSPSVEQICQKNNLSFVELLRPFCVLDVGKELRDPSGNDHMIKNIQICIQDVNDRPPQPSLARKFLNESVSNASCDVTRQVTVGTLSVDVPTECTWFKSWSETFLQVQFPSDHEFIKHFLGCMLVTSTVDPPETMQELLQTLQQMQATAPARLPKWFSSTIFKYYVVLHDAKDGDKAKALQFFDSIKTAYGADQCFFLEINSQHQNESTAALSDYWVQCIIRRSQDIDGSDHGSSPRTPAEMGGISVMPNSLATDSGGHERIPGSLEIAQEAGEGVVAVVLHPLSPDIEVNHFSAQNDKIHTAHNSNDLGKVLNTNVWSTQNSNFQLGLCLTPIDVDNIKALIKHMTCHALVPHVEKQIYLLNDNISNKKGVSRSLLSATKRLFGTNKPGSPGATPVNSVIYSLDAPEVQLRRLGDLYFMFTNYGLAFQAYHTAKRDYGSDQAWLCYAGALEMAALSAFMQGETSKKALDYMEEAIVTYLNSCKMPQFATRATLLSTECLRERQLHGEAAKQLIRMTSEDSDLRSALLLEQASYCFLHSTRPRMSRKYAFHMVLAGHRFSKAGQKRHALRCYKQAFQVYEEKCWSLAEDHIHFTIGRLAGHLKLMSESYTSLARLLTSGSKQTQAQQLTYLREYLHMQQQSMNEESKKSLSVLPLPLLEDNSSRVLVSALPSDGNTNRAFEPDSPADSVRWARMEELALTEAQGPPMIFRQTINLFSKETVNIVNPVIVVNEPLLVQVTVRNPLQIPLPISAMRLLWQFHAADGRSIHNEEPTTVSESLARSEVLESVLLGPSTTRQITLSLTPLCPGELTVLGMCYKLTSPVIVEEGTSPAPSGPPATPAPLVSGKQLFQVRGPKVKPSKDNPSRVAYGDDKRLQVKIVQAAPLLKVETTSRKSDFLCGELEAMPLKLCNSGNSPLKPLLIVTSSPHLVALPESCLVSSKVVEDASVDPAVNPETDGRNVGYHVMQISLGNSQTLAPGQELTLPLWLRAADKSGSHQVELLFYYENAVTDSIPKYRVSRLTRRLTVHDSVQLSALVSRSVTSTSHDTPERLNLSLTVKNLSVAGVELRQVSLGGGQWRLQRGGVVTDEDCCLQSQESMYLLLRADRISQTSPNNQTSEISDEQLSAKPVPPGSSHPFFDFYKWHVQREKFNECSTLQIVASLRWEVVMPDLTRVTGQSHVTLSELGVAATWPPEPPPPLHHVEPIKIFGPERLGPRGEVSSSLRLDNAVACSLLQPGSVKHCFRTTRICRVDMTLAIRNCIERDLNVTINAAGSKPHRSTSQTQLYTPHSSSAFTFTCRSNISIQLAPLQCRSVPLAVAITAPGTFDLGARLSVTAGPGDAPAGRVESALIVLDADDS